MGERNKGSKNETIKTSRGYVNHKTKDKRPLPSYTMDRQYDFLCYLRVVMQWAKENSHLTKGEIDLLLYLYKFPLFTKSQFNDYHKLIGVFQQKTLEMYLKTGFISEWCLGETKAYTQYTLSRKAKKLISDLHKMLVGDIPIPVGRKNKMSDSDKRINKYYLDFIERKNKEDEKRYERRKERGLI